MLQKATAHPRGRQCAKHKGRAGIGTAHWAEEKMAYNPVSYTHLLEDMGY